MSQEYCSNCKKLTNTRVTRIKTAEADKEGNTKVVEIKNCYCETCNLFIGGEKS